MKKLFSFERYEIKIALIYFLISFVWIFYSDRLVNSIIDDPEMLLTIQTYKGWGFVLVTTFVLYFFIRRDALKLRTSRKRIKELLEKEKSSLQKSEQEKQKLEEILLEAPSAICILQGPEHRFTYANEEYRQLTGNRELVGKTVIEALPELQEQGFFELLDKVYQTGELHKGNEVPFVVEHEEKEKTYYRNFIYKPLTDDEGVCTGIFVEAVDVSKQVKTRHKLEKSVHEKQILLSELHHRVKNNLAIIIGLNWRCKNTGNNLIRFHLNQRVTAFIPLLKFMNYFFSSKASKIFRSIVFSTGCRRYILRTTEKMVIPMWKLNARS